MPLFLEIWHRRCLEKFNKAALVLISSPKSRSQFGSFQLLRSSTFSLRVAAPEDKFFQLAYGGSHCHAVVSLPSHQSGFAMTRGIEASETSAAQLITVWAPKKKDNPRGFITSHRRRRGLIEAALPHLLDVSTRCHRVFAGLARGGAFFSHTHHPFLV